MRNESFKRIIIILSLIVAGIFVAYYFVFNDIKLKNQHTSSLERDLSLQMNKKEYILSVERAIQNISPDIDRINSSIVAVGGDVGFIEALESVAQSNGLTIKIDSLVLEDSQKISPGGVTILNVKAKLEGNWPGTYKFLEELESLSFKVKINKFGFVSSAGESGVDSKKSISSSNRWESALEISVLKYK